MAALWGGTALVPSWLSPGLSPELDSAPGSPALARTQEFNKCLEPWESNAQDSAKALPGHLGKPWMAEQGGVCVSRWLLWTAQFLEAICECSPTDTSGLAGTKGSKMDDNRIQ